MSVTLETVTLTSENSSRQIKLADAELVNLVLTNPNDENPGTIEVQVAGRRTLFEGIGRRANWDEAQKCFPVEISFVILADMQTLILLGLTRVCIVKRTGDACAVLHLFRSSNDDRGFYRPFKILDDRRNIVLQYEGGIFSLAQDGAVVWHTRLTYDDMLFRQEEGALIFTNEHVRGGRPWKMQLSDGTIIC